LQKTTEHPEREYELYSDRHVRKFPGYYCDKSLVIRPGPEVARVNFDQLKKLLLSQASDE